MRPTSNAPPCYTVGIMITTEKLCYMAGLFDGEGHVGIRIVPGRKERGNLSPHHQLHASITNTDAKLLYFPKELFGGGICVSYKGKGHKTCFAWQVTTGRAQRFLAAIHPYTKGSKHEQITLALKFAALPKYYGGRGGRLPPEMLAERQKYKDTLESMRKWGRYEG